MIAILMSVYKNDKVIFFREALESIFNQTFADYEVLLMADGPVSNEIDEYISTLMMEKVKYFKRQENKGLAYTLNELIEIALEDKRYRYFARMDSDDVCRKDRLLLQINFMERNQEIDIVGSWCDEIDQNGNVKFSKKLPETDIEIQKCMIKRNPFVHSSVMMRRSIFAKGYRYSVEYYLTEDYHLWVLLSINGFKFYNIAEPLIKFRIDDSFYSRRGGLKKSISEMKCKKMYIDYQNNNMLINYCYAIASSGVKLLPPWLKKICYSKLR